jgi:hypothetical protein
MLTRRIGSVLALYLAVPFRGDGVFFGTGGGSVDT